MLTSGYIVTYNIVRQRHVWLQVVKGAVTLNDTPLSTSDAAGVTGDNALIIQATEDAEILLFDLA